MPKYKKTIEYIVNGINDTHALYQEILQEHKKTKQEGKEYEHFMEAFNREMEKRKDDPGFYTTPQFNYLMADLWGAGADTTITTLRWFYLYMASYPKIQVGLYYWCNLFFSFYVYPLQGTSLSVIRPSYFIF